MVFEFFAYNVRLNVFSESKAARGIARRFGNGKVKHLETRTLWVQDVVASGKAYLYTVGTDKNKADVGTKALSAPRLRELCASRGLRPAALGKKG